MILITHILILLLLFAKHADGDGEGLLHGLLRRVDKKVRPVLQKKLVDPGFQQVTPPRRLTSSGRKNDSTDVGRNSGSDDSDEDDR